MSALAELRAAHARLLRWLTEDALPLWAARGLDGEGRFHDRLGLDGTPVDGPRRLRVAARQAYVFAQAIGLGWRGGGDAERVCEAALNYLAEHRQPDGVYRPGLVNDYPGLDGMGEIYDQAFVLLALASGQQALGAAGLERPALALRERIGRYLDPLGGYREAPGLPAPLFPNPSMHLFEAFQAWTLVSSDLGWTERAEAMARLALERLIDPGAGALLEQYGADWTAPLDAAERVVWPGHLYEWGFLLLQWRRDDAATRAAALRLIEVAERAGVDHARGVAIFALDGTLAPVDRGARLWAQTERLRATAYAAALTGEEALWAAALEASGAVEAFLATPKPGLWRDWMEAGGAFREEPAPASSFYHIVGAITELGRVLS